MHQHIDAATLHHDLKSMLKYGACAYELVHVTPEVIERVFPGWRYPGVPLEKRADWLEQRLRQAAARIGGVDGTAALLDLGLAPESRGTLTQRRAKAAAILGIQPDTFRRPHREDRLLGQLAMELYRLQNPATPPMPWRTRLHNLHWPRTTIASLFPRSLCPHGQQPQPSAGDR